MERARTAQRDDAWALRKVRVAKVLVKARRRGGSEDQYLVHFDSIARQYQLVGGYRRESDPDLESTARLEIEEELHLNRFDFDKRDQIVRVSDRPVQIRAVSRTWGAMTEYEIHFFQFHRVGRLWLGPWDRCVTKAELLAGRTGDGYGINAEGLSELDRTLPGGLDDLEEGLTELVFRRMARGPSAADARR
jgi:hypothetical protein